MCVVPSEYLGAFAQVAADLDVAVVSGGQLFQHLFPLVAFCVGLLQLAELLVAGLKEEAGAVSFSTSVSQLKGEVFFSHES